MAGKKKTKTRPKRTAPPRGGRLTERQRRFVEEYLISGNAADAARKAGYSDRVARSLGQRLLTDEYPNVKAAIEAAQAERSKRKMVDADKVLDRLEHLSKKAEEAGEYAPAIKATELIGKHIGMFVHKLEVSGKDGGPIEVQSARDKLTVRLTDLAARLNAIPDGAPGEAAEADGGVSPAAQ